MSIKLSASVGNQGAMASPLAVLLEDEEKRTLKKYTVEERFVAVNRVMKGEKKTHVARSIGVRESTVRGWVSVWKSQGRLPGSGRVRGKKRTTKKRVRGPVTEKKVEAPVTEKKVEVPAAAPPVVVQYVMQYQYPTMLFPPLVPVVTPYYQVTSVNVPTPLVMQSEAATIEEQAPKIVEVKDALPTPISEDASTSVFTSSAPKERIEEVSSIESAIQERIEATSDAEETPKVTPTDVASGSPAPTPEARRQRGRRRTSTASPSAQRKSIGQTSSLEGATKRKLEEPSIPESKSARLGVGPRVSKRLQMQDERRRKEELPNQPDVACPFKDIFEALNLMRRPNPGKPASSA